MITQFFIVLKMDFIRQFTKKVITRQETDLCLSCFLINLESIEIVYYIISVLGVRII